VSGRKKQLTTIPGNPPDLKNPPSGCKFHPRCPYAQKKCQVIKPILEKIKGKSSVACHYPL
jgi:oligopeptide/dipeptide ABC transporter ATP-binding protein